MLWQTYPPYFRLGMHLSTFPNELRATHLTLYYLFFRVPSFCYIFTSAKCSTDTLTTEDLLYNPFSQNTRGYLSPFGSSSEYPSSVSLYQAYCPPTYHQLRSRYSRPRSRPDLVSDSDSSHESDSSSHISSESSFDSNAETVISRGVARPTNRPITRCFQAVTTGKAPSTSLVRGPSKRATCSEKIMTGSREDVSKCSSYSLPQEAELKSH